LVPPGRLVVRGGRLSFVYGHGQPSRDPGQVRGQGKRGAAFDIGPGGPRTLRICKGLERYNLPRADTEGVFPKPPDVDEQAPAASVRASQLLKVVEFLAKGSGPEDLQNNGKVATLFADGRAMSRSRGTDLVAGGPVLPFDLDVRTPDLARLVQWVRLARQQPGQLDPMIEVRKAAEARGRLYYRFRNEEGALVLYILVSRSAFPGDGVEGALRAPTSYVISLERERLASIPRYVSANVRAGRLIIGLQAGEAGGGLLRVREKAGEAASDGMLPATFVQPLQPPLTDMVFEVGALRLWEALVRFTSKRVRLAYRPTVRCLTIGPDLAIEAGLWVQPQVLLRTSDHVPAEAPG
jgi:hypothetical protein